MSNLGGARVRSGPPPDPNALRRERDKGEWRTLPAAGRTGDPPVWPLTRQTARERDLWAAEWQRPQAVAWEDLGMAQQVALYVRTLVDAERPKATVASRTLVRQFWDALGLSVAGLRSNRWRIEDAPPQQVTRPDDPARQSAKARFRAIEGGAAS